MLALDFVHVERALTLKRIYVFFALGVDGRYVHILGVTPAAVIGMLRDLDIRCRGSGETIMAFRTLAGSSLWWACLVGLEHDRDWLDA